MIGFGSLTHLPWNIKPVRDLKKVVVVIRRFDTLVSEKENCNGQLT